MVTCGVDENSTVIPRTRFDSVGLCNGTEPLELTVADQNGVLRKKRHVCHVRRPNHVAALCYASSTKDPVGAIEFPKSKSI